MRRFPARVCAAVALSWLLASGTAWAQAGTASLQGEVKDAQGAALPGANVTLTNSATGLSRTTASNQIGFYQLLGVPPGRYSVKGELSGFRTSMQRDVDLLVDTVAKLDITLEIGSVTETVTVTGVSSILNTTDASMGNVITGTQVRALPLEARNPIGLLSLQPGAMFVPNAGAADPRNGAVSGARADQSNVTLDGVDVNDPQFGTAYSSAVRVTLDSLQEFRVSTSNYGADFGRSSAAQVSLITRSGTNEYHGSTTWAHRNTATSANEYFLKLAQLQNNQPSKPPKLNKHVYGGAVGGPIRRDKLFFFGNFEGLQEKSETPVDRRLPSLSFRDGVLIYKCASAAACPGGSVRGFAGSHNVPAGHFGLGPAELRLVDPLGIGASVALSEHFKRYPVPNDFGRDGLNIRGLRFSAPIKNDFLTYIGRLDYRHTDNHSFFWRGNFQDDTINSTPQLPGQLPRFLTAVKNRGIAAGYDAVLSSQMVNTFRYGYTEIVSDSIGQLKASTVSIRFIDDLNPLTSSSGRKTPTHNFVNDLSWIRGEHTWKFGTNLRFARIPRYTDQNSFLSATANGSWNSGVGRRFMPGTPCPPPSQCNLFPAVSRADQAIFADSFTAILGVINQANGRFNYDKNGNVISVGESVRRKYAADEYEFYAQDSWKLHPTFTVTAGLRYSLFSPPYEANGVQVAPSTSLGQLFEDRALAMREGRVVNPTITVDLAGPKNNRKGFYDWDYNNLAPRVAAVWSPRFDSGFLGWLTGRDRLVVRGGYSKLFDRVGHSLATQFDAVGSFGLSTNLSSPFGRNNENTPGIRFVDLNTMPPQMPAAPPGGFPQTPPKRAGVITSSIDDNITTPYAHAFNLAVGRELAGNFAVEAAYVGRLGRNLLVRRDLGMALDLHDPQSGTSYFEAAQAVIRATQAANGNVRAIGPIPYWENLFPGAAGGGLTATQGIAAAFDDSAPDFITALWLMDQFCEPACSKLGKFAYFLEQYDSLAGVSSLGRSDYHAMQLTLRKRFSHGYQFDFNYTLSTAKDDSSQVERGSFFGNFGNGGYTGFWLNSWEPDLHYGTSDFDARHAINVNGIAELPFGRARRYGSNMPGWLNQIVGDWSVAGLARWNSGFPFNVQNCRSCWPTNWNLQGNASLVTPGRLPETKLTKNAVGRNAEGKGGKPSPFANPRDALTFFRRSLPGEVGLRNVFRGDGYFTIDSSVAKAWRLPFGGHRLQFRWDTFNLTNTPRFDIANLSMTPDIAASFGQYNGTLASCDGAAGRCMQFSLRYEF